MTEKRGGPIGSADVRSGDARFIVIEGIDGSGSTTQGQDLTSWLRGLGRPAVFTSEPSKGPIGYLIRMALSGRLTGGPEHGGGAVPTEPDPLAMALLFAADRRDHIAAEVAPNLARGRTVICDRYLMSTLAYQGLHADLDWLLAINAKAIRPDLTIFLDIAAEGARERMQSSRSSEDIYEGIGTQRRVRDMYHDLVRRGIPALGPVVTVDSSLPRDVVQTRMRDVVSRFLETGNVPAGV